MLRPRRSSYHDTSWDELFSKMGAIPKYGASPENCHIDCAAQIGRGTEIWPDITIDGEISIGKNSVIESGARLIGNFQIGDNVLIKQGVRLRGDGWIRSGCQIGARELVNPKIGRNCKIDGLVIDSEIGEDCEIGQFAEIERSLLSWGINAKHGCGIRDAEVGYLTNISEYAQIANFDGVAKKKTKIGSKCMIGVSVRIMGGVEIGDECFIADGARVSENITHQTYFNPAKAEKYPNLYKAHNTHCAWYLAGNYLKLDFPMPSRNRSKFLQKVWIKYRLQPADEKFKEWLQKPILHLADRTAIDALKQDWKKNMDCIFGDCKHSKPEREKSEA